MQKRGLRLLRASPSCLASGRRAPSAAAQHRQGASAALPRRHGGRAQQPRLFRLRRRVACLELGCLLLLRCRHLLRCRANVCGVAVAGRAGKRRGRAAQQVGWGRVQLG